MLRHINHTNLWTSKNASTLATLQAPFSPASGPGMLGHRHHGACVGRAPTSLTDKIYKGSGDINLLTDALAGELGTYSFNAFYTNSAAMIVKLASQQQKNSIPCSAPREITSLRAAVMPSIWRTDLL